MKNFDDINELLMTNNFQTQPNKLKKIKDPISYKINEKFKLAA